MLLKVKINEVLQSETVPTSVQVNCIGGCEIDDLNGDNLQDLFSSGGNTKVTLFLRNMLPDDDTEVEKVLSKLEKKLVGNEITVQHFVFSVNDITNGEHDVVCTEGYESGLRSLVYNTANNTMSEEEARKIVTQQVKDRVNDGTYWYADADETEEEPEEEKKPSKPAKRGRR